MKTRKEIYEDIALNAINRMFNYLEANDFDIEKLEITIDIVNHEFDDNFLVKTKKVKNIHIHHYSYLD